MPRKKLFAKLLEGFRTTGKLDVIMRKASFSPISRAQIGRSFFAIQVNIASDAKQICDLPFVQLSAGNHRMKREALMS